MFDWWEAHRDAIGNGLQWAIENALFQKLSALMCVIFAVGLFALGAQHHAAAVRREVGPKQYPPGYFTLLAIQLVPMMITGFVLHDPFIIGTRVGTLAIVLLVYGMVTSKDATFVSWRYRIWITLWLSVAILGPMVWTESAHVRNFVSAYQNWISWFAVLAMLVFVVHGQAGVAKELFTHFIEGNYSVKRLSLQIVKLFAFLFQSIHYWYYPTIAPKFLGLDPIFLQGFIGTCGGAVTVISSIAGFVHGAEARLRRRHDARVPS
jgi:hypothetical protein